MPQASWRPFSTLSAIFPQDAVTIIGETRDLRPGGFSVPRCGSSVFARSGDEVEVKPGIPGCARPADANLRKLEQSVANPGLPPFPASRDDMTRDRDATSRF